MEQNSEQMQDSTVKAQTDNTLEAPVDITAEALEDIAAEAPVDITAEALEDIAAEAPVDITTEAWTDTSMEALGEEFSDNDQDLKVFPYRIRLSTAMSDITGLRNAASESSSQLSDTNAALEGPFGLGPLVFPSLQRFNNINFFLFSFCILSLAQGIIFGLTDVGTGNFERDFYLSRTEEVLLTTAYDLASLLVAIVVAHFGGRGNRPRWVAAAAFLVGLGSFIGAVPYLKYEVIHPVEENEELCIDEEQRTMPNCEKEIIPFKSEIIYFTVIGQCFQGIAGMPMYVLGVTYIYDNISAYLAGIYLGIADAAYVLGYGLGFAVGSPNLRPSVNNSSEENREGLFSSSREGKEEQFFHI